MGAGEPLVVKKRDELRALAVEIIRRLRLSRKDAEHVHQSRLFQKPRLALSPSESEGPPASKEERILAAHELGMFLDELNRREHDDVRSSGHFLSSERKRAGSFFTPPLLTRSLIARSRPALEASGLSTGRVTVLDPAVGGGAFLLEAARLLLEMFPQEPGWLSAFFGLDRSELALDVADTALRLAFGSEAGAARFYCKDTLRDEVELESKVDWLVSNPPWVAYQGRAAAPLDAATRKFYRKRYASFRGYPTLQSLFVERASELAPQGVITLLLPSSLADLDGYRGAREALTKSHMPLEPLEEYGQDAFEGVVQPSFGLIAQPHPPSSVAELSHSDRRPWRLTERRKQSDRARGPPLSLGSPRERNPAQVDLWRIWVSKQSHRNRKPLGARRGSQS
jgi:hypothetical protein